MAKYNLILFHIPGRQQVSDFMTIRNMMVGRAPDIDVYVLSSGAPVPPDFWRQKAGLPTALFSPMPARVDSTVRGARLIARPAKKFEEVDMLMRAGFPVPKALMITRETVLEEAQWGPVVVTKPNEGYRGRGVRLSRTKDVRWVDPASFSKDDPRHGQDILAQKFIDTGPFPKCYRVMTVLGKPVYSVTSTAIEKPKRIDSSATGTPETEVAANGMPRKMELANEPDVIALAEDIHAKLPHIPVMGVDIIRDAETGKLYVLELNSGGWTWHLSSDHGLRQQRDHGLDYYTQFNALKVITDALIEATRRLAV